MLKTLLIFTALAQAEALNVLFIGNSYTYVNDVPRMVQKLAEASGRQLTYDQHTEGGWTLEKHWNSQLTLDKIRKGNWDVVVIQEYSTRTSEKPADICRISFPYAKLLSEEVQKHNPNAKIQWYLTWGRPFGDQDRCQNIPKVCTFEGMQDSITDTYTTYGCMFKPGQVAPVGEGFRLYKEMHGEAEFSTLYNTNGVADHHASLKGSYLSACVHFATLFDGEYCEGSIYEGELPHREAKMLQQAADLAVFSLADEWNFPQDSDCSLKMCQ